MQISLHKKDKPLLEDIKKYFGSQVVNITKERLESIQFRVSSVKDLTVIIDHFNKYPLITRKFADYELFKIAFDLVQKKKEHLTMKGLRKIVAIIATISAPKGRRVHDVSKRLLTKGSRMEGMGSE